MPRVILIARLVGPVLVVLGVGMLANLSLYANMVGEAVRIPALIYISGLLAFTAGIAMLNSYRAWTSDWRVIVTVLGWLLVIAGIVRIVLPQLAASLAPAIYSGRPTMAAVAIVVLVLGGFLSFKGYGA